MWKNNFSIEKWKLEKLNLFLPGKHCALGKKVKWKKPNFFLQSTLWKLWKKSSYEVDMFFLKKNYLSWLSIVIKYISCIFPAAIADREESVLLREPLSREPVLLDHLLREHVSIMSPSPRYKKEPMDLTKIENRLKNNHYISSQVRKLFGLKRIQSR